jgi:ParB family chromosome partitioning protein
MSKKGAFAGLADVLSINPTLTDDAEFIDVDLNDISIREQEREEFEDDENSLLELGESLKKHQIQPIVIRPVPGLRPYELVAGERRVRGARLVDLPKLKAWLVKLTDEQAEDVRLAENIQRKNLTQLEEAKRLKKDVDMYGMEGAMERHNKSRAWFSKRLALLTLPAQASRLVTEKISADAEVITQVATVERINPTAAAELVEDLKATRGKENARAKVAIVKAEVKPSTKGGKPTKAPAAKPARPTAKPAAAAERSTSAPAVFPPSVMLTRAYSDIFENGMAPKKAIDRLSEAERKDVVDWLQPFFIAGANATDVSATVARNLRSGIFSTDNEGWFAFAAFLEGVSGEPQFELVNIFGSAKG